MSARILLLNPPIYDFAAYDFWLKPYGMLSAAGYLCGQAEFELFDYLDRLGPFMAEDKHCQPDRWSRGRFYHTKIAKPACLEHIPRHYRRFGLPREIFQRFLKGHPPFDYALVQTVMTYWYPGIQEVIEDLRRFQPQAKIILGGNYVTLCTNHAKKLQADFLLPGLDLKPLWQYLKLQPALNQPALWESYNKLNAGVLRLTDGCPFNCTYCCVPKLYRGFSARPLEKSISELQLLLARGAKNVAFYDDSLLYNSDEVFEVFLEEVLRLGLRANFHCPNALNARFITQKLARLMIKAGFKTFYLGFESCSETWQNKTGGKVYSDELTKAVQYLKNAGAEPRNITAYQILGHPDSDVQQSEESIRFVNSLGIRSMLADFSPIPGTPDGKRCRQYVDMDEPLMHNKTAFPIILLGFDEVNRLKDLQKVLNRKIGKIEGV